MESNQVKVCRTFYDLLGSAKDTKRYSLHQGGARAGKTYSILQYLILLCVKGALRGATISIVRKTAPALRASVMRDFLEILQNEGIYQEKFHNKTNREYVLKTNLFEFISSDDPQKIRGRKRDIVFCNEANELTYEDFVQLDIRTTFKFLVDYNPSITDDHWIVKELKGNRSDNTNFFKTTYKDNPFIPQSIIDSIEALEKMDPALWKIFGLGEQAQVKGLIYRWQECNNYNLVQSDHILYGMDFGFSNDPTTILEAKVRGDDLFLSERLYVRGMIPSEIIKEMNILSIQSYSDIIGDSASPDKITEIHRAGYNIMPCIKFPGSKKAGIEAVKRYNLHIDVNSLNLLKEIKHYKWKEDINGDSLNEPIEYNDHLMDPLAYLCHHLLHRQIKPQELNSATTVAPPKRRTY